MKKKLLIVANWKMNPDTTEKAREIFLETNKTVKSLKNTKVIVCPPFVYLADLEKIKDRSAMLGAQDMFWEKSGSFTGEISPNMLRGEKYVILGHSERRELGETDEMVAKKVISSIRSGLQPILCIGERARDIHGEYLLFLRNQIINSLGKLPKTLVNKLVVAYEPVWAIGKTSEQAMMPTDIHEANIFIKKVLVEIYGQKIALAVPILYGGSVNNNNAFDMVSSGEVDGLLVGRESLNPKKFGELLKNVDKS